MICTLSLFLLKSLVKILLTLPGSTPSTLEKSHLCFNKCSLCWKWAEKVHFAAVPLALQPMSGWHVACLQLWFPADGDLAQHAVLNSAASPMLRCTVGMDVSQEAVTPPAPQALPPRQSAPGMSKPMRNAEEAHKHLKSFSKGRYIN